MSFKEKWKEYAYKPNGKLDWIKLFKTDLTSILFFASFMFLLLGTSQIMRYAQDCQDNPCELCYEKQQRDAYTNPINYSELQDYTKNISFDKQVRGAEECEVNTPSIVTS